MVAVYIVIGLVAGAVIAFLVSRMQQGSLRTKFESISQDTRRLESERDNLDSENKQLIQENARLKTRIEYHDSMVEELKQNFERERKLLEESRDEVTANAEKLRKQSEEQWQIKFDKLKEEFQNISSQQLSANNDSLRQNNREQIGEMLKPLQEQFNAFRKSVEDSKTSNEVSKKELKDSFESTMKLFAQQQSQAVDDLKKETARIGNDANNLTNALKRDTKKQGNWGEFILESLLEASGLIKGVQYTIQESIKDEDGKMKRPDVIVRFPEGKSVIIDSKVSLTAYTEAFEAEDDELRRRRLKDHAKSVRKHVDELSGKNYDALDKDNIGFVLMFIPNDQCYLAAIEEDTDLSRYAYTKGIVIISPSNLMMALQLAFNMWQQDVRNRNIDKIVGSAASLYEKVAGFSETMEKLGNSITGLASQFSLARNQLYEGKGNIMKRVEDLKNLGITPKKQIKGLEEF